jgi:DNA invertase Pin-like site-specific DNA recombinase
MAMVTRLDRLARSTRDLLNTLATITAKEAAFRSLADTWADTTTPHGRLMLTVLGGLAEFEKELIRARPTRAATAPRPEASSSAANRNSPNTRSARRSDAATATASRCARSPAVITSATARFLASPPRFCVRARQATARPIKLFRSGKRAGKDSQTLPRQRWPLD